MRESFGGSHAREIEYKYLYHLHLSNKFLCEFSLHHVIIQQKVNLFLIKNILSFFTSRREIEMNVISYLKLKQVVSLSFLCVSQFLTCDICNSMCCVYICSCWLTDANWILCIANLPEVQCLFQVFLPVWYTLGDKPMVITDLVKSVNWECERIRNAGGGMETRSRIVYKRVRTL